MKILFVNFVEVNLKRKFHQHSEPVLHHPVNQANGIALVIEQDITWIKQKQKEE